MDRYIAPAITAFTISLVYAGGRVSSVGALGDAGAVAEKS
jgi:hypothetical protein